MVSDLIVVFCNWNRFENIPTILNQLTNQKNNNFTICIWNNNVNDIKKLENLKKKYNFILYNSPENIGGFGRFLVCKNEINKYKKFIFIDDDQEIGTDFIDKMILEYESKSIKSRWGWKIKDKNYFNRERAINQICDYCGTGGMIGDISIFNIDELYLIPKKYLFIEDLWLSFIATKYKYKKVGLSEKLHQKKDGKDQFLKIKNDKQKFLELLIKDYSWEL